MVASAVSLGSQATLLLQPPAFSLSAVAIPGHTSPNPWPRTDIVSRFVARDAFATQVNQSDQPSNSGLFVQFYDPSPFLTFGRPSPLTA